MTGSVVTERDVQRETGCLVYAVVRPAERDNLPPAGVDDSPLRLVAHGEVAAVVNEIALERPPGRRADLMAYSRVVDGLLADGVVVPVQFGSVLPDEQSVVEEFLAPNERYFADLFDQLAGRSQFNVRASYQGDTALAEIVATDPTVAELQARTRGRPDDAVFADRLRLGELVAEAMDEKREGEANVLCDAILPVTAAHRVAAWSDPLQLKTNQARRPSGSTPDDTVIGSVRSAMRSSATRPGTAHRTSASARDGDGTVPTTVMRPPPWGFVVMAANSRKRGWS